MLGGQARRDSSLRPMNVDRIDEQLEARTPLMVSGPGIVVPEDLRALADQARRMSAIEQWRY